MSILEIKNLSHIYDNKVLFDKAELTVNNGEHVGVVGLNGAGKSTFISILAGEKVQDGGEVKWLPGVTRGYLDQHADIDRSQTVMEYLKSAFEPLYADNLRMEGFYADMSEMTDPDELEKTIKKANNILDKLTSAGFFEIEALIKKVANGLGIHRFGYDTLVGRLSGGQRAKLMLAKLLLTQPDVMLLDEPTNFLDIEHVDWLAEYLKTVKKTFLVISHDTEFLDRVCKFIVNIQNGCIKKYGGNYTNFLSLRDQAARQYEDSYNRQQKEIEKMEEYINRNKARAATAGMANARKKMLQRMEIIAKPTTHYDAVFSFPVSPLCCKELLVVRELSIGYCGKPLLGSISFTMSSDTKLWIRGTNGIGKTTLVKTLTGLLPAVGGGFYYHPAVVRGYLEQELSLTADNACAYFSSLFPRMNIKEVRTALAGVGIKNELAVNPLTKLSGGEQVRIKLCVLMQKPANLLILDEPTNHLDVRAKESLKTALAEYTGALILVSHEREFAESVCGEALSVTDSGCRLEKLN